MSSLPPSPPSPSGTPRERRAAIHAPSWLTLGLAVASTIAARHDASAGEGIGLLSGDGPRDALVLSPRERALRRDLAREPLPPDAVKPHQSVHTNEPPASPAERNVEGGVLPVVPRRILPSDEVWSRRRFVHTNDAASAGAPAFNPDPGGRGPHAFEPPSPVHLAELSARLKSANDAAARDLSAAMPAPVRTRLLAYDPTAPGARDLAVEVADALNAIVEGPSWHTPARFEGIALRDETRALLDRLPTGDERARLNRLLLEDAFPRELPRHRGRFGTRPPFEPLFAAEPPPYPEFAGEPVPDALKTPRPWWRRDTLVPREPARPGVPYGTEPLQGTNALPRRDVRRNDKIEFQSEGTTEYPLSANPRAVPPNSQAVPDRYKVGFGFTPWHRYDEGLSEQPYERPAPRLWHPYYQSVLKGDLPVWGQDKFLSLAATSDTFAEFRSIPTPSGVSAARPDSAEFYGRNNQVALQQYFGFSAELFSGETVFKPAHWTLKVVPVFNVNYTLTRENNQLAPDPRGSQGGPNGAPPGNGFVTNPSDVGTLLGGQLQRLPDSLSGTRYTDRTRTFWALQEYFAEYHLADLSDNYDFVAVKAGNQAFNQDFRGFLFNDVNLGGRLFGNWDNNQWQYNLAGFDMREKDTYSGLNTFDQRNQRVFLANVYKQDFLAQGYTAQWSFSANLDDAGIHYDRTGAIVRPEPFGTVRPHDIRAYYAGWAGDGHIDRWNITHQFYQAFGEDTFNQLAGRAVDINAQMAAVEVSYDHDWMRTRGSFFYASGDGNVGDGTARGFDTIVDNPNFTGGPFSYYVRQGFVFGGTGVGFKQPNSLVPNLRTSKTQGQANFVNPGLFLYGLGLDIDTTPKLRTFLNANYLRFAETDPMRTAVLQDNIRHEIGWDLSVGWQYRPLLTDNIVLSFGFGVLIPGAGYRDIYRTSTDPVPGFETFSRSGHADDFLYSGVIAISFTY